MAVSGCWLDRTMTFTMGELKLTMRMFTTQRMNSAEAGWKCVLMEHGAASVMIHGITKMHL